MTRLSPIIALLLMMVGLAPDARAQDHHEHVRFMAADSTGDHRWEGRLEQLTFDSLKVRVGGADTIATFSRAVVHSVERQVRARTRSAAAGMGCLIGGVALGALGYLGGHDPDSPGFENLVGAVGFFVGCGAGAVVGLVASLLRGERWEAWALE